MDNDGNADKIYEWKKYNILPKLSNSVKISGASPLISNYIYFLQVYMPKETNPAISKS